MIDRIVERARLAAEWVSAALLFGVFAVTVGGVAMRYLFASPLQWGDELGMILLLWTVFIVDAFVTRDADHVAFDLVWDRVGPRGRRVILVLQGVLFAILFAVALPVVVDYILFLRRERTSSLEWRLDFVYLCFAIYLAALVVRLAAKAWRAIGSNWRREVEDSAAASTSNVIG
jgi:TRAP-type transport system small permease protein